MPSFPPRRPSLPTASHDPSTRSGSLDSTFSGHTIDSTAGFRTPTIPLVNLPLPPLLNTSAKTNTFTTRQLPSLSSAFHDVDFQSYGTVSTNDSGEMVDAYARFAPPARKGTGSSGSSTPVGLSKYSNATDLYNLAAVANGLVRRETPSSQGHNAKRSRPRSIKNDETALILESDTKRIKIHHDLAVKGLAGMLQPPPPDEKLAPRQLSALGNGVVARPHDGSQRSSADSIHTLLAGLESRREEESRSLKARNTISLPPAPSPMVTKMEPPAAPLPFRTAPKVSTKPQAPPSAPPAAMGEDPLSSQILTQRTALFFERIYSGLCSGIFPRAYIYPMIGQNWQRQDPSFAALALSMSVLGLLDARMPSTDAAATLATMTKERSGSKSRFTSPKTSEVSLFDSLDLDAPFSPPAMPSGEGGVLAMSPERREQVVTLISLTLSTRSLSEGSASFGQQPGCTSIMTSFLLSLALWCLEEAEANAGQGKPGWSTWKDAAFLRFSESIALAKILGIDQLAAAEAQRSGEQEQPPSSRQLSVEERERRVRLWALLVRAERWWSTHREGYRPQLTFPSPSCDVELPATTMQPLFAPIQPKQQQEPQQRCIAELRGLPPNAVDAWQREYACPLLQPAPLRARHPDAADASIIDWIRSSATISEITPRTDSLQLPPIDDEKPHPPPLGALDDDADSPFSKAIHGTIGGQTPNSPAGHAPMLPRDQLAVLTQLGFSSFRQMFASRFAPQEIDCWQGRCAAENCYRLDSTLALHIDDSLLELSISNTSAPPPAAAADAKDGAENKTTRSASLTHRDGVLLDLIRQVFRCRLWRASLRHGLIVPSPSSSLSRPASAAGRNATSAAAPSTLGGAAVPPPLRPDQPLHIGLDTLDILEDLHDVVFAPSASTATDERAQSLKPMVRAFLHEIADCVRAVAESRYRDEAFVLEEEEDEDDEYERDEVLGRGAEESGGAATALPEEEAEAKGGPTPKFTELLKAATRESPLSASPPQTTSLPPPQHGMHTKTTIQQGSRAILFDLQRFFQQVFQNQ